jgi:hypothetical protein
MGEKREDTGDKREREEKEEIEERGEWREKIVERRGER